MSRQSQNPPRCSGKGVDQTERVTRQRVGADETGPSRASETSQAGASSSHRHGGTVTVALVSGVNLDSLLYTFP